MYRTQGREGYCNCGTTESQHCFTISYLGMGTQAVVLDDGNAAMAVGSHSQDPGHQCLAMGEWLP
jgi:hypothetical protein